MKGTTALGAASITRAPQKGGVGDRLAGGQAAAPLLRVVHVHRREAARVGGAEGALLVPRLALALGLHGGEVVVEAVARHLVHQVQAVEGVARIGDAAAQA